MSLTGGQFDYSPGTLVHGHAPLLYPNPVIELTKYGCARQVRNPSHGDSLRYTEAELGTIYTAYPKACKPSETGSSPQLCDVFAIRR